MKLLAATTGIFGLACAIDPPDVVGCEDDASCTATTTCNFDWVGVNDVLHCEVPDVETACCDAFALIQQCRNDQGCAFQGQQNIMSQYPGEADWLRSHTQCDLSAGRLPIGFTGDCQLDSRDASTCPGLAAVLGPIGPNPGALIRYCSRSNLAAEAPATNMSKMASFGAIVALAAVIGVAARLWKGKRSQEGSEPLLVYEVSQEVTA
jgi:hypothetical protein